MLSSRTLTNWTHNMICWIEFDCFNFSELLLTESEDQSTRTFELLFPSKMPYILQILTTSRVFPEEWSSHSIVISQRRFTSEPRYPRGDPELNHHEHQRAAHSERALPLVYVAAAPVGAPPHSALGDRRAARAPGARSAPGAVRARAPSDAVGHSNVADYYLQRKRCDSCCCGWRLGENPNSGNKN